MEITKVITQEDGSFVVNDEMTVPDDMMNKHRMTIQKWIDSGNTPTPYVEPEVPFIDKRAMAYDSVVHQLDMQYWDLVNGTTEWKDHIAKVKSDIPKE